MRVERLAALLGVLLAAAAVAEEPTALLGRRLSEIRFSSDGPIDKNGLRTLIAIKPGEPVTAAGLAEAKRLIDLTELFRSVELRLEPDGDLVALAVAVSRRPVIHDVVITGLHALKEKEARRLIRLDKGTIYDQALVDQAQQRVIERYHRMAFPDALVQVRVEPIEAEHGDVALHFDVEEGVPEKIAAVVPEGDLAAWDASLQKRTKRIEGGRRTREAIAKTERKLVRQLRAKGYYEARLHWTWEPLSDNRGILRLGIDSGPRFVFEVVGNHHKRKKRLLGLVDLEERLIVTDGTWRQLAERMREDYQRSGYYHANVAVEIGEGDPKTITYRIEEAAKYRVSRIVFEGNERLPDRDLRAAMETSSWHWLPLPGPGRLVTPVLNEDMKRIRHLYRTRGFPSAVVHRTRREVDEKRREITIVVPIVEGPQTIVREVRDEAVPREVHRKALAVRAGAPLDPEKVEADRRTIRTALERDGHPAPRVEPEVAKSEEHSGVVDAAVAWDVDPGQRQRVGRLVVQHNVDTRSEAILRELPFKEGDPLAVDRMLEGQVAVYKLGLFRSVSIEPISTEGEPVRDVAVNVTEQAAGTLGFGGGYNTRDGIKAFAEVGYDNVGGMARRLSLRAEASLDPTNFTPDQYLGNLGFIEPRLLDSPWRYKVNLIGERSTETVDKFSLERAALVQGVDRRLWKRVQGGIQLEVERARVFDVKNDADVVPEDEGTLRTVAVSPFLAYDGRDDPFVPTRGLFDSIAFRYSFPTLSDVQFAKFTTQHTQWIPLGKGVTFVYSARLGAGRTISGSPLLPIRERFFLGGRTTVRGFSENYIGPFGRNGHEVGGDLSINVNTELLVPIAYGFQVAFFVDGGGLYLLQCDAGCRSDPDHPVHDATFSIENFRRSAGLGLRYNTPVGPVALDYGIKLDRRHGETFGRLHFNIGTTF